MPMVDALDRLLPTARHYLRTSDSDKCHLA